MEGYALRLVALGIVIVLGIASQFELGRFLLKRHIKLILLVALIIIFGLIGYAAIKQYFIWLYDPLTRFLLPPYQGFNYFAFYALSRFFGSYLVSLGAALLLLQTTRIINQRSSELFFEKEEPYLAATSVFLVGHPGWLVYLVTLIFIYFILHTLYFILRRQIARLPLYRLWAPIASFVILINEYWLSSTQWWALLSI